MNAEFKAQPNLASLYSDDVHPNDAGYQVMAQAWFKAITRGRAQAASARPAFRLLALLGVAGTRPPRRRRIHPRQLCRRPTAGPTFL